MVNELSGLIAIAAAITSLANILFIKPFRDRLLTLEQQMLDLRKNMADFYTKGETIEAIELRQKPIADAINSLNNSVQTLNSSVSDLRGELREFGNWRERMIGAGYSNGKKEGG